MHILRRGVCPENFGRLKILTNIMSSESFLNYCFCLCICLLFFSTCPIYNRLCCNALRGAWDIASWPVTSWYLYTIFSFYHTYILWESFGSPTSIRFAAQNCVFSMDKRVNPHPGSHSLSGKSLWLGFLKSEVLNSLNIVSYPAVSNISEAGFWVTFEDVVGNWDDRSSETRSRHFASVYRLFISHTQGIRYSSLTRSAWNWLPGNFHWGYHIQ